MSDAPEFGQSKPFERTHLIEDAEDEGKWKNLRLNDDEKKVISELMDIFHCDMYGTVIKKCVYLVHGIVTQSPSMRAFFEWLSNERRIRPGPKIK